MHASFRRLRVAAVGVSVFALVALVTGGTLAASTNPPTLYACYNVNGQVAMSDIPQCKLAGGGRLVNWTTVPAPGPTGPTGAIGPTGPVGPTGAQGEPGTGTGWMHGYSAENAPITVFTGPNVSLQVTCLDQDTGYVEVRTSNVGAVPIITHFQWTEADGTTDRQDLPIAVAGHDNFHIYGGWGFSTQVGPTGAGAPVTFVTISATDPQWLAAPVAGCDYVANWQLP
jgi:hypothetical protein